MSLEITELIGKRVLLKGKKYGETIVEEFKILELAPSGRWIKVQNQYGNKYWKDANELFLVEVLLSSDKPINDNHEKQ